MARGDARPSVAGRPGTVAVAVGLIVFALRPFLPFQAMLAVGALLLAGAGWPGARPGQPGIVAGALTGGLLLYAAVPGRLFIWPAHLLVPILTAGAIAGLRRDGPSFRSGATMGSLGRREWFYVVAIALISGSALIGWVWYMAPISIVCERCCPNGRWGA